MKSSSLFFWWYVVCLPQCQKSFPRFVGRHLGRKKHCRICGNIVCVDCLNPSAVRIVEFCRKEGTKQTTHDYVDACASCYWGQVMFVRWRKCSLSIACAMKLCMMYIYMCIYCAYILYICCCNWDLPCCAHRMKSLYPLRGQRGTMRTRTTR